MKIIRFAWVCRNIKFDEICREELTDEMLLSGAYPSYITSDNCEIIAKILPIGCKDENGIEIWQGDILEIITENYELINIVCKYGIARRTMDSGWEVDIPSFYFEREDGLKSFPIFKNWQGKHDLEIMKIIGNIYENPELLK